MTWTAGQAHAAILTELGVTSTDTELTGLIPTYAAEYATLPADQIPLLIKKRLVAVLLGRLRIKAGSAKTEADLTALRAERETLATIGRDIDGELARIYASRGPLSGSMAATQPTTPPVGYPDANAARYRGWPYPPGTEDW